MGHASHKPPILAYGLTSVLAAAVLFATPGCGDFACGYGGPGCGSPELEGPCGGELVRGESVEAYITYFDDTGTREATVRSVRASDAEALRVSPVRQPGTIDLVGMELGSVALDADIEGWARPQRFELRVVEAATHTPDAGSCAGACCATVGAEL